MLRTGAVTALLLQEIASLAREEDPAVALDRLDAAMRRAGVVALVDVVVIAVLMATAERGVPFLSLGHGERAAFSIGVLLVAAHAGFRAAQYLTLRAVRRAIESLPADE